MFPVKHLAPKIFIAVYYCGRQLVGRLVWVAPAYHEMVGATLHPGVCKFSLQYDDRPDGWFGVGMWNLGSLSGKGRRL